MASLSVFACICLSGNAVAHTTLVEETAPADGYYRARFLVAHGCGTSPTHTVRVQIPSGVEFLSAWHKPGWILQTVPSRATGDDDEPVNVREVLWTGSKIPANEYDYFEIQVKLPDEKGRVLYFKTIQLCDEGDLRWIEIPEEGRSADDYESPAPSLTLTAH
jgi:uncharacterized protein YcnI